jgi:hypothetical protein
MISPRVSLKMLRGRPSGPGSGRSQTSAWPAVQSEWAPDSGCGGANRSTCTETRPRIEPTSVRPMQLRRDGTLGSATRGARPSDFGTLIGHRKVTFSRHHGADAGIGSYHSASSLGATPRSASSFGATDSEGAATARRRGRVGLRRARGALPAAPAFGRLVPSSRGLRVVCRRTSVSQSRSAPVRPEVGQITLQIRWISISEPANAGGWRAGEAVHQGRQPEALRHCVRSTLSAHEFQGRAAYGCKPVRGQTFSRRGYHWKECWPSR